jgi:hypothetical protein
MQIKHYDYLPPNFSKVVQEAFTYARKQGVDPTSKGIFEPLQSIFLYSSAN